MKDDIKFVGEFEKRVTKLENNTITFKDQIEKNYSSNKEGLYPKLLPYEFNK